MKEPKAAYPRRGRQGRWLRAPAGRERTLAPNRFRNPEVTGEVAFEIAARQWGIEAVEADDAGSL
jgi:hypothetical protein